MNLQPLKWINNVATAAGRSYTIHQTVSGDYYTRIYNMMTQSSSDSAMYDTLEEVKHFAEFEHYIPKTTAEFLTPDSITDIANWFKAAKPEPTNKDKTTQLGCAVEEFAELMESVGLHGTARELTELADEIKGFTEGYAKRFINHINKIDALDATSDITVTVQGFNQLMGFDGLGALKEVIRSNNSKMVKGKFEFDANGKIQKPDSYSKPDLTKFISTMENLHNASEVTK